MMDRHASKDVCSSCARYPFDMNEDNSGHNVEDEEDGHKDNHMDEQDHMRRDAI